MIDTPDESYEDQHTPWLPGEDLLQSHTPNFEPMEDLCFVIEPYRTSGTEKISTSYLQPTKKSVKIVDLAITQMIGE